MLQSEIKFRAWVTCLPQWFFFLIFFFRVNWPSIKTINTHGNKKLKYLFDIKALGFQAQLVNRLDRDITKF